MIVAHPSLILGGALGATVVVAAGIRWRLWLHIDTAISQYLALLLVLAWAALLGTMAALEHITFHSTAYDLGIYDQLLWNSAHGRLFQVPMLTDSTSYLGHHFSPILLALVPLYWIRPDPATLVAAQALLLAVAGLPIFWLARDLLGSNALALAILLAYLLHPATAYMALFDFHGVVLATPLLALALVLLVRRRFRLMSLALALMFLVREDMGLVGAAIGIYVAVVQRRRLLGAALAAAGLCWTFLLVRYVIPSFNHSDVYPFMSFYAEQGGTPRDVLATFLHDPGYLIAQVFDPGKLSYLPELLLPLAALPLLGWPVLIVALPALASVFLADSLPTDLIRYQYSATVLPPLLVASIVGLSWLRERCKPHWRPLAAGLAGLIVVAALLGAYLYGPLPMARNFEAGRYQSASRLEGARQLMAQIPPDASVIAQSGLVPQLGHRRVIQLFGDSDPALRPDYYFLDTDKDASRYPLDRDGWPSGNLAFMQALARITGDAKYQLVGQQDGYLLFKHETPDLGQTIGVTFGDRITLVGYKVAKEQASAGDTLHLTLYWRAERKLDTDYTMFLQMVGGDDKIWGQHDDYPTGKYFPTSEWTPGRLYRADWSVPVAPNAPVGQYQLLTGLYNLDTMQRLVITGDKARSGGDALALQTVSVVGAPQ